MEGPLVIDVIDLPRLAALPGVDAAEQFPLARLLTDRYRREQINEACDALEHGRILGWAIIEF